MRVLTEQEMDEIFGGDGTYIPTLSPVTVTAQQISNSGGFMVPTSAGFNNAVFDENGNQQACYYSTPASALPASALPDYAKLKCQINASATPGHGLQSNYSWNIVNSYAFTQTDPSSNYYRGYTLQNSSSMPANYNEARAGNTITAVNTSGQVVGRYSYLYAGGMVANPGPTAHTHAYVDAAGTRHAGGYIGGPNGFTATEVMIITGAHEAAHQWAKNNGVELTEERAEGYGVEALIRFRAGAANGC